MVARRAVPRAATVRSEEAHWAPSWARTIGIPVWVVAPDGTLSWINRRARDFLGVRIAEVRGRRCHDVVASTDERGRPLCSPECPLRRDALEGRELRPFEAHVRRGNGDGCWIRVLPLTTEGPRRSRPWIVHCVLDVDRAHRAEGFLRRVGHRTPGEATLPLERLTPREREVLDQLLEDRTLFEIADQLHVSHATVRNHVHHILHKTGAHTILEAVARALLRSSA